MQAIFKDNKPTKSNDNDQVKLLQCYLKNTGLE